MMLVINLIELFDSLTMEEYNSDVKKEKLIKMW